MNTLSIKLPKLIDEQLTATAKKRKRAKAAVVVEALQEYFARHDAKPVTAAELMKRHNIVIIDDDDAPTDLSTNKTYMEGYGR